MATVRLTDTNKSNILIYADNMFNPVSKEGMTKLSDKGDLIYNFIYPLEVRKNMEALDASFFPNMYSIIFEIKSSVLSSTIQADLKFTGARRISNHHNRYGFDSHKVIDIDAPENAELKTEIFPIIRDLHENEQRRKLMREHLSTLMAKNQTVGMCIKVWPQFIEVLPADLLERHLAVTKKVDKEATTFTEAEIMMANATLMAGKLLRS